MQALDSRQLLLSIIADLGDPLKKDYNLNSNIHRWFKNVDAIQADTLQYTLDLHHALLLVPTGWAWHLGHSSGKSYEKNMAYCHNNERHFSGVTATPNLRLYWFEYTDFSGNIHPIRLLCKAALMAQSCMRDEHEKTV